MGEIKDSETSDVAEFIQATFSVGQTLALDYARIAVFLSDASRCDVALAEVSARLESRYWTLLCLEEAQGVNSNLLTRAISSEAASLGFTAHLGIVLAGFAPEERFIQYVRKGVFWKDAVSSNHGEHSHSIQWLMIAVGCKTDISAASLYKRSVDYRSTTTFYHPDRAAQAEIYLWDFLVDCFDHGKHQADYRTNITTATFRSPTYLNKTLFATDCWLGDYLHARYARRHWALPGPDVAPTPIRDHARNRHQNRPGYTRTYVSQTGENAIFERTGASVAHSTNNWAPVGRAFLGTLLDGALVHLKVGWNAPEHRLVYSPNGKDKLIIRPDQGVNLAGLLNGQGLPVQNGEISVSAPHARGANFRVRKVLGELRAYDVALT